MLANFSWLNLIAYDNGHRDVHLVIEVFKYVLHSLAYFWERVSLKIQRACFLILNGKKQFFKTSLEMTILLFDGKYLSTLWSMMSRLKNFKTYEVIVHLHLPSTETSCKLCKETRTLKIANLKSTLDCSSQFTFY